MDMYNNIVDSHVCACYNNYREKSQALIASNFSNV